MSPFQTVMAFVLEMETSKITDDPRDRGGLTKYGISQTAHPGVDIRNLTEAGATAIYKRMYWDAVSGDKLNPIIAACTFDAAVNMGPLTARLMLQRVAKVKQDGDIGPATLAALAKISPRSFVKAYTRERLYQYALMDKLDDIYGRGWINRAMSLYEILLGIE